MDIEQTKKEFALIFHEIAPEVEFHKIKLDLPLRDQIEIDSYDFYRIVVTIKKKTGVNIPDSKLSEFRQLEQLISYVSSVSSALPNPHQWPGPAP